MNNKYKRIPKEIITKAIHNKKENATSVNPGKNKSNSKSKYVL